MYSTADRNDENETCILELKTKLALKAGCIVKLLWLSTVLLSYRTLCDDIDQLVLIPAGLLCDGSKNLAFGLCGGSGSLNAPCMGLNTVSTLSAHQAKTKKDAHDPNTYFKF